jgi:hypothetical protein
MSKRGPKKQYPSEKERNRAKQQRHRDKINSVTTATTVEGLVAQLNAADHCIKCNELTLRYHRPVVCAEHASVARAVLAKLKLTDGKGSNLDRKKILTGTNIARVSDARNVGHGHGGVKHGFTDKGKPIKEGRFTGCADMLPDVLAVQGIDGPGREELIKTILPWFTVQVQRLEADIIRLNPLCHHEDDVANIVHSEAIGMVNAELAKPKEQRIWA